MSTKKAAQVFDVAIVGAGPAGMFAAYELISINPKLKVALIDMGNKIQNRKPSEVMSGIGGAGTFSDGKLHFSPNLSHEKALHLINVKEYQKILDQVDQIYTKFGVDSDYFPKPDERVDRFVDKCIKNDIELKPRKIRHVGTDKLRAVMTIFQNKLEESGINIIDNTEIADLIVDNGTAKGVLTKGGKKILAKKVLLAPGRVKAKWLQDIAKKYEIAFQYDIVEVGVRVEFPAVVMKEYAESMYEAIFKIRTKTFDDIVRTFCPCPNGLVALEKYDGYVCVNGHSNSDHLSENSNFAFLCEVHLTEPVENSVAYAKSIAEVASTIGGGKPLVQRLIDLQQGRRSTWSRINKSIVNPSLKDVTPGDIAMALPHRTVTNILEGLAKLDNVMPGVNSGSTLLYAPEVKFRSTKITTTPDMQTNIKGVYVAGDAAGLSGSITGAAATGIMAARGMTE